LIQWSLLEKYYNFLGCLFKRIIKYLNMCLQFILINTMIVETSNIVLFTIRYSTITLLYSYFPLISNSYLHKIPIYDKKKKYHNAINVD